MGFGWLAAVALIIVIGPFIGLLIRADWGNLPSALASQTATQALWLSLKTGLLATIVCFLLGLPLAWVLARSRAPGLRLLRALVLLPLVLPPMAGGLALLYLLGRRGLLGTPLAAWGVTLPFSTTAVVIAQVFVALPFFVITVESGLEALGTDFEEVAATLGAGPWQTLWYVTLPMLRPSLIAAIGLTFARALGEFGATALFAGNSPGRTQTMPLAIYTAFNGGEAGPDTAVALTLLLVASAAVIIGLGQFFTSRGRR
ncbi:MAG: ABC transporter permease [Propionibacteriaceae bacterium]|jgi:molybdate transport system permease protein|nr:ABC transporter permease [Propionibacteriaceae bacterium]